MIHTPISNAYCITPGEPTKFETVREARAYYFDMENPPEIGEPIPIDTISDYVIEEFSEREQYERFMDFINKGIISPHDKSPGGDTFLHVFCQHRCTMIIKYLLDQGLDVNVIGSNGDTPFHSFTYGCSEEFVDAEYETYYSMTSHKEIAKLLIDAGADLSICDVQDMNPLGDMNGITMNYMTSEYISEEEVITWWESYAPYLPHILYRYIVKLNHEKNFAIMENRRVKMRQTEYLLKPLKNGSVLGGKLPLRSIPDELCDIIQKNLIGKEVC